MGQEIYQVDAFTSVPFAGNPAAVCVLPCAAEEGWMQSVAAEMNLAETAFLHAEDNGYRLRWFTPEMEVDLCGHATLASAHILWEESYLSTDSEARFLTRSGRLSAIKTETGIELDFPNKPTSPANEPSGLRAALGVDWKYLGWSAPVYLAEVESEAVLRAMQPDFRKLALIDCLGVIVTCQSETAQYDFISRFFAPSAGIDEDPVTGSAHCSLAPYWQEKLGKTEMIGFQASKRGGVVGVRLEGDRVKLIGQAVTVLRGELE